MQIPPYRVRWGQTIWGQGIMTKISDWCDIEIGRSNYTMSWVNNILDFHFKTEEDKVKFILRWL